jgi:hypothetical protein
MLTQFFHLALQPLKLLLHESLMEGHGLLWVLRAHELLRKIEGGVEVGLGGLEHLLVYVPCARWFMSRVPACAAWTEVSTVS